MFKTMIVTLVIGLALFFGFAAMQPNEFRVERSLAISAPASKIFPYLNDAHKINEWSPWAKIDPDMKQTFTGPAAGVGASAAWVGNKNVGEGSQTIVESQKDKFVKTRLDFIKPFKATNTAEFALKTEGKQTIVTWSMYGPNTYLGKVMGLIMNCDKMVGVQFERGLLSLKELAEKK